MLVHPAINLVSGKKIEDLGEIESEYTITRISSKNPDTLYIYRVKGAKLPCYSNIITTRKDLYNLFQVDNDIELYEKYINAINSPPPNYSLELFEDYYEKYSGSLKDIPFIKFYREDGGYYLTGSIVIAKWNNIHNASIHRIMRLGPRKATLRIVPRHLYYIVKKHAEKEEDTPIAVILGAHPVFELAAATSPPFGKYELDIYARITMDKRIVETPIHGLRVPVNASVIIEGRITQEEAWEGPFVDILRMVDKKRLQPVLEVDAIYVNKKHSPMIHAIVPGYHEHYMFMGFPKEPVIYESVKKSVPRVKSVRLTRGGSSWLHIIVSIEKTREGEAVNAGMAAFTAHPSAKLVIVIDHDIDVDDPFMIEWAIATRVKPSEDIHVIRRTRGSTLDPRCDEGVCDKVIVDATKPLSEPWTKYRMVKPS